MPFYRLYFIDPDGAIESVEAFSARDDAEAVRISHQALGSQPLELWRRARFVEALSPGKAGLCRSAKGPGPKAGAPPSRNRIVSATVSARP